MVIGSGVQRLLDARANEVLGCPRIFSIFLVIHQTFHNSSNKIYDDLSFSHLPKFSPNDSLFRISFQISRKFASFIPPPVLYYSPTLSYPVNNIFSSFLVIFITYIFLTKIGPLDAPGVDALGRRTVRTLLCTPLVIGLSLLRASHIW